MPLRLNHKHRRFDLHLEILGALPMMPRMAVSTELQTDFGLDSEEAVMVVIENLCKHRGFEIVVMRARNEDVPPGVHWRMGFASGESWRRAQFEAEEYWNRVYG